ncbi:catechol 2,3-dioxygenase-like lactoylglutathione lyase family enzyme [Flavobacterium chryseum]|uniref:VOC family protein n=1 Tax=Flavobacterium sp. P3160 TaxID=2512113 RepID=UPI00105E009D|nr:VOC family protein [Flavobacterium sp. P3160]TDO73093.1 catechol 2,3-dioxygenase-like lactoylglutathione lyase family enzyme [Flavobacterium sp. P3160]
METTSLNKKGLASFSLYNVAFTVADLDQSIEWYKSIFGFDLVSRVTFTIPAGSAETAIIKAGELRLELLQVPNAKRIDELFAEAPQHLIPIGNKSIVLQVDDLAVASQELEEKGVTFVWRELYIAGDKMLCTMIQDVDGNKINIFQTNTIIGN